MSFPPRPPASLDEPNVGPALPDEYPTLALNPKRPGTKSRWESSSDEEEGGGMKRRRTKSTGGNKREARRRRQRMQASRSTTPSRDAALDQQTTPGPPTLGESTLTKRPLPPSSQVGREGPRPPLLGSCKSVEHYEKLNRIEEGTYGVVYRARDLETGEVVALKRLKLDKETQGFPVTSLREIHTLMTARHPHIVRLREMVTSAPSASGSMPSVYLVMDFVEHDLRGLLEAMPTPFLPSEVKTLMQQLLSAAALMHSRWILHRDLKPSNLLMNNTGHIVVADFGLARTYGEPQDASSALTTPVVTLWYRPPEVLLGSKTYGPPVDMWSIGCIFAELLSNEPLFPGKGEMDQLSRIFQVKGLPTDEGWPGWRELPHAQGVTFRPPSGQTRSLRTIFPHLTHHGLDLLTQLLAYDPDQRISAQEALKHPYFSEAPLPKHPSLFPSWPSKASQEGRQRADQYAS